MYRAAVKRHLLADVPVGILLSGGLDSGLLLALMNEHGRDWPAYTIGYGKDFADDELVDAAETASLLGARHTQVQLDQAGIRKIAARHRPVSGGTGGRLVHRADVFCLPARAAGRESRLDWPGTGRTVRRLQAASWRSVRKLLARHAQGDSITRDLRCLQTAAQ